MVYTGGETAGRVRDGEKEMVGQGRSKPPLHNFNLPFLKWGSQRLLRCVKVPDDQSAGVRNGGDCNGNAVDRCRSSRSPPNNLGARNHDVRRFKFPNQRSVGGGGEEEEGIAAVGEKIMFDLRTEAEKMKDAFFRKQLLEEDDLEEEEEEESASRPRKTASSAAAAAVVLEVDQVVMPWNLRTRRAAFKAPDGGNSVLATKGLKIEERRLSSPSPRLRGEKEKQKERPKFSVPLSKREIEEDFWEIIGQRPARRPKKRPRIVQKQLDTLFPGLWLTEVTADMY